MRILIGMLVLALVSSAFAQEPDFSYKVLTKVKAPPKIGITKEQLETIATGMIKNAESWFTGQISDYPSARAINEFTYSKENIPMLKEILGNLKIKAPKNIPGGATYDAKLMEFYVIVRLLKPLQYAPPDVLKEGLPLLKEMEKKYHNAYKAFPKYPPPVLANFQIPDCKGMGAEARLKLLEAVDKRRQEKVFKERPITINNELIGDLETIYVNALLNAQDPKEDAVLVSWIADTERKGNYIFTIGIDAIISFAAVNDISPERAEAMFTALVTLGEPLKWESKDYLSAFTPVQLPGANSELKKAKATPGYLILTAAKYVGLVAKKPPIVVPHPSKRDAKKYAQDPEFWNPPKKP